MQKIAKGMAKLCHLLCLYFLFAAVLYNALVKQYAYFFNDLRHLCTKCTMAKTRVILQITYWTYWNILSNWHHLISCRLLAQWCLSCLAPSGWMYFSLWFFWTSSLPGAHKTKDHWPFPKPLCTEMDKMRDVLKPAI